MRSAAKRDRSVAPQPAHDNEPVASFGGVGPLRSGASGVEFHQVSHKMTNEPRLGNGLGGLCQKPQRLIEVQWSGIIEDKNRKDFTNSILMPFEEDDIGDTVGYQWYSMVFYNEINIIKKAF